MSKRELRTCCVCHRQHSFCPVCNSEDKLKPSWYYAYCSENCKDIYNVTAGYENGEISADEAKEKLNKLDLSDIDNFGESYQNTIKKINGEFTKVVSNKTEKTVDDMKENVSEKSYKKSKSKGAKTDDKVE